MDLYTFEDIVRDIKQKGLKEDDYLIIENLENCRESTLDYDKRIYVANLLPNKMICNSNSRLIVNYLRSQGSDLDLFFTTYYTRHSMRDLNNYYAWISLDDFDDLYQAAIKFIETPRNPRLFRDFARIALEEDYVFWSLLEIMLRFVSLRSIYELVPMLARNMGHQASLQYITQEKTSAGKCKVIFLMKYFENFIEHSRFWWNFEIIAMLESVSRRIHFHYPDTDSSYYQFDIMKVLQDDYGYLKLDVQERDNGIYVNGRKYAQKVLLNKERLRCRYSLKSTIMHTLNRFLRFDKHAYPMYREVYSNTAIALDTVPAGKVTVLLEQKKAVIGYQVIRDLIDEQEGFILKEGEIFNLPYTRLEFSIDLKHKLPFGRRTRLSENVNVIKTHLFKLRQQVVVLEHTTEIAHRQSKSAEEAQRKLAELNITLEQKVKDRTLELERARDEIEKTSRQKTNLFINLAHETKTPLTLVSNLLERYIAKAGLDQDLLVIQQSLKKLCRDMVNFLDSEKLEQGQIFYDHEQVFDLSDMAKYKVILFREIAQRKKILIFGQIEEGLYIKADPFAIDRIFNNLLDNAIRYTGLEGQIDLVLASEDEQMFLRVGDTGVGISAEHQQYIFEPYYQISHEKRNIQGIGMGLHIVKKILDSLHAEIRIQSELNKGTQFTVIFKKHTLQDTDIVKRDLTYSTPLDNISHIQFQEECIAPHRPNVLIVEDNLNLLQYIQSSLQETYNVFLAANGKHALEKIGTTPKPDIIVSDIMMDVMDGYQFYREISNDERYSDIPFIFLSARTSMDEKIKGLTSGAIDYIYKPFSIDELAAKINSVIRNQNLKKTLYEKERYATLGMLFGTVSHDILNPLAGVYAPLENLERECEKLSRDCKTRLKEYFERIYKNLERIEDLLKSLKILCYQQELNIEPLNIEEIIMTVTDILNHKISDRIIIQYEISDGVIIRGSREAVMHILLNLMANAIESIPDTGEIRINVELGQDRPVIRINDTGCGIPPKEFDKIFDVSYTSKALGKGSGLGLYIVHDLVQRMHWHISVRSDVGQGTEFTITT